MPIPNCCTRRNDAIHIQILKCSYVSPRTVRIEKRRKSRLAKLGRLDHGKHKITVGNIELKKTK